MANNECLKCETFGTSCCESSLSRRDTATSLAKLVHRQMGEIERMTRVVEAADLWEKLRSAGRNHEQEFRDQVFALGSAIVEYRAALTPATMKEAA